MNNWNPALRGEAVSPCCYGLAPPKLSTPESRVAEIAEGQVSRLKSLLPDALIVYDIQDEPGRSDEPRPFPFLPTRDPAEYAQTQLEGAGIPTVVYRSVSQDTAETLTEWLQSQQQAPRGGAVVLVGAASSDLAVQLRLSEAYQIAQRTAPSLPVGAIAIAERHREKGDEHVRMQRKLRAGCRFFVTQAVYDAQASLQLVRDYAGTVHRAGLPAAPLILTFAPCASAATVKFMKWLGISFPPDLEHRLLNDEEPLERSLAACEETFAHLLAEARSLGVVLGINVESVSIRRTEIEASVELFERLRSIVHS